MSTYPEIRQSKNSTESFASGGVVSDRATNGAIRARSYYSSPKKLFTVIHEFVPTSVKTSLETFYNDNKNNEVYFLWLPDGVTYQCIFHEGPPQSKFIVQGYWTITVSLAQI